MADQQQGQRATAGGQVPARPIWGQLVLIKSNGSESKSMTLRKDVYRLGRDPACEVQLRMDEVEPVHATITHDPITDSIVLHRKAPKSKPLLDSDGNPLPESFDLAPGDKFQVGPRVFRFDPAPGAAAAPVTQAEAAVAAEVEAESPAPARKRRSSAAVAAAAAAGADGGVLSTAERAPEGCLFRFSRKGTIDQIDVTCVTELCRKFHIAHGALNDLVQGRKDEWRNWRFLGLVHPDGTFEPGVASVGSSSADPDAKRSSPKRSRK